MIRFSPPVIEGNITSVNNLLEVNGGVLQFGGTAIKNTVANQDGFNVIFVGGNNSGYGLSDWDGTGLYFSGGFGNSDLSTSIIAGQNTNGNGTLYKSGANSNDFVYGQVGFVGVQIDTTRNNTQAEVTIMDSNTSTKMGLETVSNAGTTLYMQGFAGETVNFDDASGTPWFTYVGDTAALTIGNTGTGVTLQGAAIGFFGNSVSAQSATTVAAAITVADLVAALTTWQTALNNYGLITFV